MSVSIGSIVGAVGGAVIGFFVGGWWGIYYGAVIGFTLGSIVDPVSPDVASPGSPFQPIQVTTNEIGFPIPDLLGTGKISGNLLCYGKEFAYAIEDTVGGKGSDTDKVTVGYVYYASWAIGVCLGPVDTLLAVYRNDKAIWSGEVERPASGGEVEVTLPNMGKMVFYFGTDDQVAHSNVGDIIDDSSLNSPNRGLCWAFFNNCSMGQYNRMPTMKFVVRKVPVPEFAVGEESAVQIYDYNSAYAMWYILCELAGLPLTWLDTDSFVSTALTLLAESRGMSILFDRQNSAMSYLEMINKHIDGIMYYGTDSQFHTKLLRNDYVTDDLPLIDETVLLEDPTFTRKSWVDTLNEIKVQYTELIWATRDIIGTLWDTGKNGSGQLGLGDYVSRSVLTLVDVGNIHCIGTGLNHSIIIKTNSTLWATGNGDYGRLGLGDVSNRNVFTQVGSEDQWKHVSNGCGEHTMAIKKDNTLWGTGRNISGELGLGDNTNRLTFTEVGGTWLYVACGYRFTLAIKSDFSLWATGYGANGQLGLGGTSSKNVFTLVSSGKWAHIAAGYQHALGIKFNKSLYATGYNYKGMLGLGDGVDPDTENRYSFERVSWGSWKYVACGYWHTLAIQDNGSLWGAGWNASGEIGLGETGNSHYDRFKYASAGPWKYVACGIDYYSFAINSSKKLYVTGSDAYGQAGGLSGKTFTQINSNDYEQIACGEHHSLALQKLDA